MKNLIRVFGKNLKRDYINLCHFYLNNLLCCIYTFKSQKLSFAFVSRETTKEKDRTEGTTEETEEREQATPRGRKTANSQGRRKGRITRSMTSEAAAANAAASASEEPPQPLPPPPEPS